MLFPDIVPDLKEQLPGLRGALAANAALGKLTTFHAGGAAQVLFKPEDEEDLSYFLSRLSEDIPVTIVGRGSNLLVRDAGVPGIAVRLGSGFNQINTDSPPRMQVGGATPDVMIAYAAQKSGIAGFSFLCGIPGFVGGTLRMNGGCYKSEIKDVLKSVRAVDRKGQVHVLKKDEIKFEYRFCDMPQDFIVTQVELEGAPGDPADIAAEMTKITAEREEHQPPVKMRTGGSTFKNPSGKRAWELIRQAGCGQLRIEGAEVSSKHANFLINYDRAAAAAIETLGETIRQRVKENSGIDLEWEVQRIGLEEPFSGAHAL